MSTETARPAKVAIIGASGTYGRGILARAEKVEVEAVVVTRSPHKFDQVKPTTTVVETTLDDEETLHEAFSGCDGVISALGDDRKERPKTHCLPHVWRAMKAAGVTKYVGMGTGGMLMPGERRGLFQHLVRLFLAVQKLFGVDLLEQNVWERDSLLQGENGADGLTWVLTRVVRPTETPFVGAYVHKDQRGPLNCSIYDHGDFCLYCVASNDWNGLAPHVSTGPPRDQAGPSPAGAGDRSRGGAVQDETECTLAETFSPWQKMWAQGSFLAMGAVGTIGIGLADWRWALAYLVIYTYGIMGVVMRHLVCPRCPHLHLHGDCLQAPARLTRWLVKTRKTGPLSATERALFYAYFAVVPTFPIYWLLMRPALLVPFLVFAGMWYLAQLFYFCKRCRVRECPFNRAAARHGGEREIQPGKALGT